VTPIAGAAQATHEHGQVHEIHVAVGIRVAVMSDVMVMRSVAVVMVFVMHRAGIVMMLKRMVVMRVGIVVDRADVMMGIGRIVMRKMMIGRWIARMQVMRHGMVHGVGWNVMV
jgi:hypothetical protein